MSSTLKPLYDFVNDAIELDQNGDVVGNQAQQVATAKLIVQRVASHVVDTWAPGSMHFLALAAELALCVLVADRAPGAPQPGLKYLIGYVSNEVRELPEAETPHLTEAALANTYLGVIRYSNGTLVGIERAHKLKNS